MNETEEMSKRNFGIDAFRLLSMYMIVILHIVGHGGVLQTPETESLQYKVMLLLQSLCMCAVNCFAIISGYVLYGKRMSSLYYIRTWAVAAFYSCIISAYFYARGEIGTGSFLFSILPVAASQYWYFTAYTVVSFLLPVLNRFCVKSTAREARFVTIALLLLGIYGGLVGGMISDDPLQLKNGYSGLWLTIMVLVGMCIRKNGIRSKRKADVAVLIFCPILYWALRASSSTAHYWIMDSYINPLIVAQAISLIRVFASAQVSEKWKRALVRITPGLFAVYLIHDNRLIREQLLSGKLSWVASKNIVYGMFVVLGISLGVLTVCILIDMLIRKPLFQALKIDKTLCCAAARIDKLFQ